MAATMTKDEMGKADREATAYHEAGRALSVWHYTTGDRMAGIVATGLIRTATALVDPEERPAVWFTTSDKFPPTARKGIKVYGRVRIATLQEMDQRSGGLFRICVADEEAPVGWTEFKRTSGIAAKMASALAKVAIAEGEKPSQWRCSFDAVPRSHWTTVERLDITMRVWHRLSENEIDALATEGIRNYPQPSIATAASPGHEIFPDTPIFNIDTIFSNGGLEPNPDSDPRPMLAAAQVITVVDHATKREEIVYGIDTLTRIAKGQRSGAGVRLVRIGIDVETDELEKAIAVTGMIKGTDDYQVGSESN